MYLQIRQRCKTSTIKNDSTVLDGEIGEWDPNLMIILILMNPELDEIDGNIPTEDEYYTISVTVPVNMEFMYYPNR